MDPNTGLTIGLMALAIAILAAGWAGAWWLSRFSGAIKTEILAEMKLMRADLLGIIAGQGTEVRRLERELAEFKMEVVRTYTTKGEDAATERRIISAIHDLERGRPAVDVS